jgi:LPXTG-motif cell wall-anchored protein
MAKHRAFGRPTNKFSVILTVLALLSSFFGFSQVASAAPVALTIENVGWNVVGLDSNDVNDGPNQFPQEFKVCNTSNDTAATGVEADFNWTSANALISLDGSTNRQIGTVAANSCVSFWWTVTVTRDANAYDTWRNFTVSVNDDGAASASTSTQLAYVEHLISQNRNVVNGVTGPTSVTLGDTVQFVLTGATATQGYEQIVTAPVLSSSIFEITSVTGSYAVGGTISNFYYDGCDWDPAGVDVTTWDCLATGKAGGDPITVTVTAKVIGVGTAQVGGIIYDFSGSSFHYNSDYSAGAFTVTAAAPVPAVTAVDDAETTDIDTPVDVDLLANDTVTNGTLDPASVNVTVQPSHGSVTIDLATGKATYTPNAGYSGTDTFTYQVCSVEDPAVCDTAVATITINPAGVTPPTAVDDADTTEVDTSVEVDVLANDTVGSNSLDPSSVVVTVQPNHGTVTVDPATGKITYTPDPGYTGTDTFTYAVCDTGSPQNCDTAEVTITIEPAAVLPVVTAVDDAETTDIDTPVDVDLLANDSATDGTLDAASVNVTVQPSHGSVTIDPATGKATYTPNAGYSGTDTFTYEVCEVDHPSICDTAVATITINPAPVVPVVTAVDDAKTTTVDTPVDVDLLVNDTVTNGTLDPASVNVNVDPAHGTVVVDSATGKATYTPNAGYTGTDTFTYEVCSVEDPAVCDTAVVTITIDPVKDDEVTGEDVTKVDGKVVIDPTTIDPAAPEIDPTTVEIVDEPTHGTVVVDPATGEITYTPDKGYKGTDSFTFKAAKKGVPGAFVYFTYNVNVTDDPAEYEKTDSGLANTGSDSLALALAGLVLMLIGGVAMIRRVRKN